MGSKTLLMIILLSIFILFTVSNADEQKVMPVYKFYTSYPGENVDFANDYIKGCGNYFRTCGNLRNELNSREEIYTEGESFEIDDVSGGIWYENKTELWNLSKAFDYLRSRKNISLMDDEKSKEISYSFIIDNSLATENIRNKEGELSWNLFNESGSNLILSWELMNISGTKMTMFDLKNDTVTGGRLDVQLNYGLRMDIINQGISTSYPIINGTNPYVILGEGGQVIGYSGPKPIIGAQLEGYYPVIPEQQANRIYEDLTNSTGWVDGRPYIAYFMQPMTGKESFLIPVYVYTGIEIGSASIIIPATTFPLIPATIWAQFVPYTPFFGIANISEMPTDNIGPYSINKIEHYSIVPQKYKARAYYNDTSSTILMNLANAGLFLYGINQNPWVTDPWVPKKAFKSDFTGDSDIDSMDIAFYTGQGNMNGWLCEDGWFDVSNANMEYGNDNLKWLVVDACNVLADSSIPCWNIQGDVMQRWSKVFNGLHLLLGFGTITEIKYTTGYKFDKYMMNGNTIINSWFRTAKDVQPDCKPPYFAGVLYPYNETPKVKISPENDHLYGCGSISPDIKKPDIAGFCAVYSPC